MVPSRVGSSCSPKSEARPLERSPTKPYNPSERAPHLLGQVVFEIVFTALGITGMELHLAADAGEFAGSARHRESGVAGIEERTLDGNLSVLQCQRPKTFPCLSRDGANAPPVVIADFHLVGFIVDLVGKRQYIAGAVTR